MRPVFLALTGRHLHTGRLFLRRLIILFCRRHQRVVIRLQDFPVFQGLIQLFLPGGIFLQWRQQALIRLLRLSGILQL